MPAIVTDLPFYDKYGGVTIINAGHENVDLPHEMAHAVKVEKV